MATDQYSAFEGNDDNDPYAAIRKTLGSRASMAPGGGMGAPGATGAPGAGVTTPGSYGSLPTAANYSAASSTPSTSYPGGGPPQAPQGQSSNPWGNTSAIQGMLGGNAANASDSENSLVNQTGGIRDFLSGDPTKSPLYTSLLSNARESISNSYDQAVANTRSNAESRGFGYESPVEQGSETGVRAQEAGALSAAPSAALQTTVGEELSQEALNAQMANMYNTQDIANLGDITSLQQARMGKNASMFSSLMQIIQSMISGGATAGAADLSHA